MRAVIEIIPALLLLYGTFLLGQVNQRRKYKDRRDPLPVIAAARNAVVSKQVGGQSIFTSLESLEIALDAWDLHHA